MAFAAWCRARRLTPLPAHPWTVAAYARWCESRHRYPALVMHIRAISRAHLLNCSPPPDHHPTVARTLRLIEARERTRGLRAALFPEEECAAARSGAPRAVARNQAKPGKPPVRRDMSRRRTMAGEPPLVSRRPGNAP